MIQDTIEKLEARLENSASLKPEARTELLQLLARLKKEVGDLATTNAEQAQSITGFTDLSTHEAMRQEKNPELLDLSIKGLSSSVQGFEESHPRLVQIVNSICTSLSNIGI